MDQLLASNWTWTSLAVTPRLDILHMTGWPVELVSFHDRLAHGITPAGHLPLGPCCSLLLRKRLQQLVEGVIQLLTLLWGAGDLQGRVTKVQRQLVLQCTCTATRTTFRPSNAVKCADYRMHAGSILLLLIEAGA